MISIRKLASALCWAICCLSSNVSADTSANLIDPNSWQGATYGADPGGCCASISGSAPLYDTTTGVIMFSYGQSTISQTIGVNQALGGTGIQVNGYTYNWDYRLISNNGNPGDTLTANISLKNSVGSVVESQNFSYNTQPHDVWLNESGTTTFANPYTDPQSITLQFTGKDGGFWAGYYGPEIKNVSLRANYTSDPCAADPLYSTTCPGYAEAYKNLQCQADPLYDTTCPGYAQAYFNQQCGLNPLYDAACPGNSAVIASGNLVPKPEGQTGYFGGLLNNSFAINTALSHGGSGVMIHGFEWGYRATNYDAWLLGTVGSSRVNVNIRDGDGTSLYSWSRNNTTGGSRSYSSSYVLPQSMNNLNMGNFDFTATSSGFGNVDRMWARALLTPDQCTLDPLSSTLCTGYAAAFLDQQCALNTLYSPSCPGYQEAFAALLAAAIPETTTTAATEDPVAVVATASATSSTPTVTEDPTKDQTEVTTDVGGAELTATGEVVVSDGIPSDVKESVKESTETKEETKTAESSDKKKTKVNAVALAQAAARDAEKTALSAASDAQTASLSDAANPADGIGLTGSGIGFTVNGFRLLQGMGNDQNNLQADNQAMASSISRPRQDAEDNGQQAESLTATSAKENTAVETNPVAVVEQKEESANNGPAVRRGGRVEGMEGGADINALAAMPANFNDYLSQQMQDSQFYASKEIYRGQRNVDNARALRGLGTDRLHQQMVEQQYNIAGQ